jgi:hypothetical protein
MESCLLREGCVASCVLRRVSPFAIAWSFLLTQLPLVRNWLTIASGAFPTLILHATSFRNRASFLAAGAVSTVGVLPVFRPVLKPPKLLGFRVRRCAAVLELAPTSGAEQP